MSQDSVVHEQLKWTKEKPTMIGFFWILDKHGNIKIEHVWCAWHRIRQSRLMMGDKLLHEVEGVIAWAGPIPIPPPSDACRP